VSEGVFLMYPWRKMYSTSTYSSTILFCPIDVVNILGLKGGAAWNFVIPETLWIIGFVLGIILLLDIL